MSMTRALTTRFTKQLGAKPIILAPMGGCAGGSLAAAVSSAGAVGFVGSGGESLEFLRREWALALEAPHDRDLLGFGLNVGQQSDVQACNTHGKRHGHGPCLKQRFGQGRVR